MIFFDVVNEFFFLDYLGVGKIGFDCSFFVGFNGGECEWDYYFKIFFLVFISVGKYQICVV